MRRLIRLAAVAVMAVVAAWSSSRAEEPTTERTDPNLPNIPGPFHPFNITGAHKGRFHSRISEHGLEPMMMIFTREVNNSDPLKDSVLKDLLTQIGAVVQANPDARLHPFVVVQSADLPEVVGADDKADDLRLQLNKMLSDDADDLKLQPFIDVDLAGKADLEKFQLDDANFAFYLFQRGKVTASRVLRNENKLTAADVKAIMALDVAPFGPQNTLLLVTRDADLSEPLKGLLQQIDDAAEKNPAARLHPVLALLSDDPTKRNELAAALEAKTKDLMLKHVEVVVAGPSDLARYHVESAPFAFFLLQHGKAAAGRALTKDEKLTADVVKEIMTMAAEKAGADKR